VNNKTFIRTSAFAARCQQEDSGSQCHSFSDFQDEKGTLYCKFHKLRTEEGK